MPTDSPARRVRTALIAAGMIGALGWAIALLFWRDGPFAFTFDDAYYYVGIARNLASRHGSTFDGINLTNGYHPLWMAICVLPFKLGLDDLAAVRTLLLFQLVVGWGGSLVAVAVLVSRQVDGWRSVPASPDGGPGHVTPVAVRDATVMLALVFLLIAANPFIVKTFVNGLESGIAVVLYALLLLMAAAGGDRVGALSWIDRSRGQRLGASLLLALIFLARTDALLLLGCLGLWCLAEAFRSHREGRSWRSLLGALLGLFGPAAVVIAGYLLVDRAVFGTPFQVSGLVKRAPLDASTLLPFAAFAVIAAALGWRTFRRSHADVSRRSARFPLAGAFVADTGWFAAFSVLVVGYYQVLQTQQWLWYYCPVLLYLVVLFMLAVADIIGVALVGVRPGRSAARALAPLVAVLLVPLVVAFALNVASFRDPAHLSIQMADREAGVWLETHTPPDAVLASWDAGVVGYFSHRHVVNIDGVANSFAFYNAILHGTVAAFLRCDRIGYVVNHGADVNGHDPAIVRLIAEVYGDKAAAASTVIERVPFRYTGMVNLRRPDGSQSQTQAVYVYEIPLAARGPRSGDRCP